MDYTNGCITLNRVCNLRCEWCYAKNTGYAPQDNMPLTMAKDIVDICKALNFRHIKLMGGEPTLYPSLFDLIAYANKKLIRVGFPTNGLMLSDKPFAKELINHGINHMSISLKGVDSEAFKQTTGIDAYDKVIHGIENCISLGASVVVFMVLSNDNIDTFLNCVKSLKKLGVSKFRFTFVYNFDTTPGYKSYLEKIQPRKIVDTFKTSYEELDTVTDHKLGIFPTFPACFWGEEFIKMLDDKKQLVRGCPIKDKSDLIFDSQGNLIPCSAMYPIKLGQLYRDFSTTEELLKFCNSNYVNFIYDKYHIISSKKCADCKIFTLCDCCSCQWTNYSFEQLMQL